MRLKENSKIKSLNLILSSILENGQGRLLMVMVFGLILLGLFMRGILFRENGLDMQGTLEMNGFMKAITMTINEKDTLSLF